MSDRRAVLHQLLSLLRGVNIGKRVLVAIDGLDGAGKTVLAQELVEVASQDGLRPFASLSIDGFHHPRSIRYENGLGPDSFYRDSYDYDAFIRSVVTPFRHGLSITPAVWDVDADLAVPRAQVFFARGLRPPRGWDLSPPARASSAVGCKCVGTGSLRCVCAPWERTLRRAVRF